MGRDDRSILQNIDWVLVGIFLVMVLFGWMNIYAAVYNDEHKSILDFTQNYGKQSIWIVCALFIALMVLVIDGKFYAAFSYAIYVVMILLLLSTFAFAKNVKGSYGWIDIGAYKLQPAEFAKFATNMALAKFLSTLDTRMQDFKTKLISLAIIGIPAIIILLQNDTGSALVFGAFVLVLYREGLSGNILLLGLVSGALFVLALLIQQTTLFIVIGIIALLILMVVRRNKKNIFTIVAGALVAMAIVFSVDYFYNSVLQDHQRIRIDVLLGNDTDRILSNNHHNLSVFGVGRDLSKKQWQILAHQLIRKEIVIRDSDYGSLKLSQSASDVLFNNKKVFGVIKEPEVKRKKLKSIGIEYDQKLFELLRIKRKQIADQKSIPPFVIFADSSLIQMAKDFPQTENEFLRIGGVGVKKLESYCSIFLSIIKNYAKNNDVKQKSIKQTTRIKKSSLDEPRHRVVAKSYNDGSLIAELAEEYNVQEQTIVNHLARFTNKGNRISLDGLLERVTIDKSKQKKVFNEFDENGTVTMRNIFEKFNGEISYNELHLLRVIYLNNRKK